MDNPTSPTQPIVQPIDHTHSINAAKLARITVHNSAGECAVALVHPLAKEMFRQAGEGHFMLCTEHGQDPLASVTVRGDSVKIYSERLAGDLAVGQHDLIVVERMLLGDQPAIQTSGPRR